MMIDKEKLLEYLNGHIGNNTTTFDLIKASNICKGMSDKEIQRNMHNIDPEVCETAEENGFRFNSHHHDREFLGMPWAYDFYIEIADVEKDIARISSASHLKTRKMLIEEEYGIYDEKNDLMIGFRMTIPWQIKKIYDEMCDEIDRLESEEKDID